MLCVSIYLWLFENMPGSAASLYKQSIISMVHSRQLVAFGGEACASSGVGYIAYTVTEANRFAGAVTALSRSSNHSYTTAPLKQC